MCLTINTKKTRSHHQQFSLISAKINTHGLNTNSRPYLATFFYENGSVIRNALRNHETSFNDLCNAFRFKKTNVTFVYLFFYTYIYYYDFEE